MKVRCRGCAIDLDFDAKSETISYYCSLRCYHGGAETPHGAVIVDPKIANAAHAYQIAQAHLLGTQRGLHFRIRELHAQRRPGKVVIADHQEGPLRLDLYEQATERCELAREAAIAACLDLELP